MKNENNLEAVNKIEWMWVPRSSDWKYEEVLEHKVSSRREKVFKERLIKAVRTRINGFNVPVYDPSLNEDGKLQFKPGCMPAINHSYNEWEMMARDCGGRLGNGNEYILFSAILISRLMEIGCSEANAWYSVVTDSRYMGLYSGTVDSKLIMEKTGSRVRVGKYDLGNVAKILSKDKYGCITIASGAYNESCYDFAIAQFRATYNNLEPFEKAVGWIVF